MPSTEVENLVPMLLAEAALQPDASELAAITGAYPALKEGIEAMYVIPEIHYVAPALTFNPSPTFVDWAS
jgi:hypothetical protein